MDVLPNDATVEEYSKTSPISGTPLGVLLSSAASSVSSSDESATLVNECISPRPTKLEHESKLTTDMDEKTGPLAAEETQTGEKSNEKSDAVTTEEDDKGKEKSEVIIDRPGYRKELRTAKSGRKYSVETKGLWTTVKSLTPHLKKQSLRERLAGRLKNWKTFYPFLVRFAAEVVRLGRWRFLLHLIGSTITGLVPAMRIYLSSRLISIAQTASEKRILRKGELFIVALSSYFSSFFETWIDGLLADNNGILQRRFEAMVSEHLMNARARLDIHTIGKRRVQKDFDEASSLISALGDGTFVVGQLIDLFTSAVSLSTQASMLWSLTTADNADLAMVSIFSASLMLARWFTSQFRYYRMAITDKNFNRMSTMEYLSHPWQETFGERKVLGLGKWVLDEYKKASNKLGDVSLAAPNTADSIQTATEAIKNFSDTAIYVLFALKVSDKPLDQATLSMSSLTFIQGAARGLASSLYRFVRDVQHFGSEFSAFRAYYRVMEIKTAINEPVEPVPYRKVTRTLENGEERTGMEIEFRNVSFTWPGKKERALDDISFEINAGELCAIVGYNGAGKSTLIALMARLVDPSSGTILVNGHDIKSYSTADLHGAMSLLFQSSADLPLTIREFIGIGSTTEIEDMAKIRKAAEDSGAIDFIDKLENGFESTFSGSNDQETPETMYKEAVEWDEYSDSDSDSDDEEDDEDDSESESDGSESESEKGETDTPEKEGKKAEDAEDDGSQDDDDDDDSSSTSSKSDEGDADPDRRDGKNDADEGGRLAFSGGQRQKLLMARNFMRVTDLAIFDEYSASLDPLAEHELFKRITANRGKQTLLYITHRYSTVRHADRILMLEKGKVSESGTHDELMAIEGGKYAEMCRLALGEGEKPKSEKGSGPSSSVDLGDGDASEYSTFRGDSEDVTRAMNTPLPMSPPLSPTLLLNPFSI